MSGLHHHVNVSRQLDRLHIQRTGLTAGHHNCMLVIELVHLLNTLQRFDGFVGLTCGTLNSLSDSFFSLHVLGADFHHTTSTVGKQQIVLAVFFVHEHV